MTLDQIAQIIRVVMDGLPDGRDGAVVQMVAREIAVAIAATHAENPGPHDYIRFFQQCGV